VRVCPYCGKDPEIHRIGFRAFLAKCPCGAFAAFKSPTGIHPAVMRLRKTALQQWDLMIHRPDSVQKVQAAVQDCADRSGPYSNPIERFATPEHLANHRAKIALGEKLLEDLS
jgi:hypothetical protein